MTEFLVCFVKMLILLITLSVVALTVLAFHRQTKQPVLTIVEMAWSPLQIDWIDSLSQLGEDEFPISDQTGGGMHSDQKCSPCFSELFDDLSSSPHTEANIIRYKVDYFSFPRPSREQNHSENRRIALRSPVSPSNRVLEAGDSNVFMAQRSEGSVLPPH